MPKFEETLAMPPTPRRAAAYVRMSTKNQHYSIEHQLAEIYAYAAINKIEVVRIFSDAGRSGLDIKGRPGMQELIATVQARKANFELLIVLDISRWGRFQDPDQAAHYEFICKDAGIPVCYCGESFGSGTPMSSLEKGIKRLMAAEKSRDLSMRVFAAQARFTRMGFLQGGPLTLGLRRTPISANGAIQPPLRPGERKRAATDHVLLAAGPQEEVEVVRQIFHWFVVEGLGDCDIARRLNASAVPCPTGRPWTHEIIKKLLINEKYIGNLVFYKTSCKLRTRRINIPESEWVRSNGVIAPIVDPAQFQQAQEIRRERNRPKTDDDVYEMLKKIHREHGKVTSALIDADRTSFNANTISRRFGSLWEAYAQSGIPYSELEKQRAFSWAVIRKMRSSFHREVAAIIRARGHTCELGPRDDLQIIDRQIVLKSVLAASRYDSSRHLRWTIKLTSDLVPDFVIARVLDEKNRSVIAHYLLRPEQFQKPWVILKAERPDYLSEHRQANLESFFGDESPAQ